MAAAAERAAERMSGGREAIWARSGRVLHMVASQFFCWSVKGERVGLRVAVGEGGGGVGEQALLFCFA